MVEGPALDLQEGNSYPAPGAPGSGAACERWPEHLRLRSTNGEMIVGRCKATNKCPACSRMAAVENSELLALDAMNGVAPSIWAVLTTRTVTEDPKPFWRAREAVQRALRRRWPAVEYAYILEFTTGYGTRSGGDRRPHWNLLLKGIPVDELEDAAEVIRRVWCGRVDAEPQAQHVGEIAAAGGLMRYLALHFQKSSQAPPVGWTGHRFRCSEGYLWDDTQEARYAARWSLRFKRELHRAKLAGIHGQEADVVARAAMAVRDATRWELVHLAQLPATWTEDGFPATFEEAVFADSEPAAGPGALADGGAAGTTGEARRPPDSSPGSTAGGACRRDDAPGDSSPSLPAAAGRSTSRDGPPPAVTTPVPDARPPGVSS
jgi:hypothetical protein